jgi:hypothetical protein
MTTSRFDVKLSALQARWVVEQACLAPSIHNTQPWSFYWDGEVFELYADTSRGLTATDPDGRELVMSCGAALYNMRLTLRKISFDADVSVLPDPDNPRLLARVLATESTPATVEERRLFAALLRRHTHRGGFDDEPISADLMVQMQRAAELESAALVFLSDPGQRRHVLTIARAAERACVNDLDIQREVEAWTPTPGSRRRDGVPVSAYASQPTSNIDDLPQRDFDQNRRLGAGEGGDRAPGIIGVLVTENDLQHDWLYAGQALERLLVVAARSGAFAAIHSQLTEVEHLRNELRRELCVADYPQLLLRFGYAPDAHRTPRRPLNEVWRWQR